MSKKKLDRAVRMLNKYKLLRIMNAFTKVTRKNREIHKKGTEIKLGY